MGFKDWLDLAKTLVTVGTLIFTAVQALLLRKQIKKSMRNGEEKIRWRSCITGAIL